MAGTKSSGRPGGNPDLEKYQFTTDKDEPCTSLLALRISKTDLDALKSINGWQSLLREKVQEIIKNPPKQVGGETKPTTER